MLAVHQVLAVAVIAVAAVAAGWGGIVWRRRREPGPVLLHALTLVQTLLIGQVAVGLLLLSDDRRAAEKLHYLYGVLALAAVLAPWIYAPANPRSRLGWFAGASLLAALLAVRAYTTA
jgi:hypothetical protein